MEIIGNESVMFQLEVAAKACKEQRRPLPHTLFTGPAGCGKTTIAKYISELMGTDLINLSPLGIGDTALFAKTLIKSAKRTKRFPIVFVDEIHHISVKDQELLGVLMEELMAPVKLSATANEIKIKIPPFTFIGATTDAGKLLKPFRDRFKLIFTFKTYTLKESIEIAKLHANRLGISPSEEQYKIIAESGRFTPRTIVSILERYRDFTIAINNGGGELSQDIFNNMLKLMGILEGGLTNEDVEYLKVLADQESAVGLETLSLLMNEGPNTIRNTIEPYLLRKKFIARTPRGRTLTDRGLQYLYDHGFIDRDEDFNVQDFEFLE